MENAGYCIVKLGFLHGTRQMRGKNNEKVSTAATVCTFDTVFPDL